MPLKKIEQNVHKEYHTWVLENIQSEILSKIDPNEAKFAYYPIQKTYTFSTEVQGHAIDWNVTLKFAHNELIGGFIILFDVAKGFEPKNHITCNFHLVDADENKYFLARKNWKFNSTDSYTPQTHASSLCFCCELPNTIDKLLPNDTMTLHIELITYLDDDPIFPYEEMSYIYYPDPNLSDDFFKLYKVQDECDVMINVQGVTFPVHKRVLKARCPKLYEMVDRQKMSDDNDNQVALTDIKPDIFRKVLEFIYTGKVENLDDHAEDLLEAASKYELRRLKNLCEFSLMEHYLTYENSEAVKELAMCFGARQLFDNASIFQDKTRWEMRSINIGIPEELSLLPTRLSLHY